mmetsp:Transcript_64425/g.185121  ORF Transcript_64425/g.185121 Transcript_64425/m.185121 type:complete len:500 (-) Transcript_64425:89-1588(-)
MLCAGLGAMPVLPSRAVCRLVLCAPGPCQCDGLRRQQLWPRGAGFGVCWRGSLQRGQHQQLRGLLRHLPRGSEVHLLDLGRLGPRLRLPRALLLEAAGRALRAARQGLRLWAAWSRRDELPDQAQAWPLPGHGGRRLGAAGLPHHGRGLPALPPSPRPAPHRRRGRQLLGGRAAPGRQALSQAMRQQPRRTALDPRLLLRPPQDQRRRRLRAPLRARPSQDPGGRPGRDAVLQGGLGGAGVEPLEQCALGQRGDRRGHGRGGLESSHHDDHHLDVSGRREAADPLLFLRDGVLELRAGARPHAERRQEEYLPVRGLRRLQQQDDRLGEQCLVKGGPGHRPQVPQGRRVQHLAEHSGLPKSMGAGVERPLVRQLRMDRQGRLRCCLLPPAIAEIGARPGAGGCPGGQRRLHQQLRLRPPRAHRGRVPEGPEYLQGGVASLRQPSAGGRLFAGVHEQAGGDAGEPIRPPLRGGVQDAGLASVPKFARGLPPLQGVGGLPGV